ncbi:MAG: hypothetical protein AB7G10_04900 [Reyranellaceae bacterium]
MNGSSPAATGPAGARFEGQVGAHYLLTMLAHAEPRGLPGTTIDRISFQRGNDGFPLDDVVVHAHENATGCAVTLQVQVKRSIQFSPSDAIFKKVVGQIAKAIAAADFWAGRNELAIATASSSRKIDGAYQDVLRWARQFGLAKSFFEHLNRPGVASNDMRSFVSTLRDHLRDADAAHDDEAVWKVLGRLQILIFDYTSIGSAAEELSRERAVRVLPPEDAASASSLWGVLTDLSEEIAADGGDRDRARLLTDLASKSIRVAGGRRFTAVRAAIAEASAQALADMIDRIGETVLARTERVEAINEALDKGRYLEIRGDAGVGKSGLLRHFAELFATEGRIVVLTPERIPPRGWTAMRAALGFDGTARDLLSDLAFDGGTALFIDNLDSFGDDERRTVNDLLRAASQIPSIVVIVTARRNFGVSEPSWLDQKAIAALGPMPPVVIEELSEAEITELGEAEPRLAGLLADSHPAKAVVRNLYRLSRLAAHPTPAPAPTTELDMAERWWISADGERDAGHRERARLLRRLADMVLCGGIVLDVKDEPSSPIDALVRSETLRDRGADKVTFRHDILRQWAIGNLLNTDDTAFDKLPLDKPASEILARGVELAARFALERQPDGSRWASMLDRLSKEGIHGSWRRAALLGIVHSETAVSLLGRETTRLLDNGAALLRELIRTLMAVDTEPASQLLVRLGVSSAQIPTGMFVPTGTSWFHLLIWLLKLGPNIPAQALGDVVELYTKWMFGTFGLDPITPKLLACLYAWLVELEDEGTLDASPRSYSGRFDYGEARGLADKLRIGFLPLANKRPDLAVDYLNRVRAYKHDRGAVSSIMKFRGSLALAAPKELAALTAESLIAERQEDGRERLREEPFRFIDHEFRPEAPAQGPFLDLLTHAPDEGLSLVRKLAAHAIEFRTRGRDPDDDGFRIPFDDGEQFFPWTRSYRWSRSDGSDSAVTCGLMALEAWAHQRIERGDDVGAVLKDVLGPPGTSAAFLLVAVDLIISQWPKTQSVAVPFLACPELVSLDRTRQSADQIELPDQFGLNALEKEPVGSATRESLKRRLSRQAPLERLVGFYSVFGPEGLRAKLERLLRVASQRLGIPESASDFADPRFMVRYELNLVDPANWSEREVLREDGTVVSGREYVSPRAEAEHLSALNVGHAERVASTNMRAALLLAIDDPSQSSPELAARAVVWARQALARPNNNENNEDDDRDDFVTGESIRAAALVVARDGDDELRRVHGSWAEQILLDALNAKDDVAHRMRSGLKFNPIATTFAGISALYRREPTTARLRSLLNMAARESPAAAHGFAAVAAHLAEVDERIPKAIVRCGFAACVKPIRQWSLSEEEADRRAAIYAEGVTNAAEAELAWLKASGPEPAWPDFEPDRSRSRRRRRRGVRIGGPSQMPQSDEVGSPPETYIDEQAAALWIGALWSIVDVSKRPWLRELVTAYAAFSAKLNGLGLGSDDELSRSPYEWNRSYYELLGHTLVGLTEVEIDELAVTRITTLPDQSFFDITPQFLRTVDIIYFNSHLLEVEAPVIRQRFIDRLIASYGWRRLVGRRSSSIEFHLGPAVGAIFFNEYGLGRTATYMKPKGMERIAPFLPALVGLLTIGPSYFVAFVAMDLLEVSAVASLLPVLVAGGKAWVASYGDDTSFWVEYGIGRRFCAWIDRICDTRSEALATDKPERKAIEAILAVLVRLGVAEARVLETRLAGLSTADAGDPAV